MSRALPLVSATRLICLCNFFFFFFFLQFVGAVVALYLEPFGGRCTCGAYSGISPRSIFRKSSFLAAPTQQRQLPSLLCMEPRRRHRAARETAGFSISTHNSVAHKCFAAVFFSAEFELNILASTSKVTAASPSLSHDPKL